ncbi:MAG: Smr/MutS family protein [Acidobacteria bacterium]|nr:Smr/MutS family protein [Acidobacteriota bacterium]
MDTTVLRTLEFDRIREALARETLTPLGQARARQLDPSSDPVEVQHQLDATGQAVAWLDDGETLSITAPDDLLDLLEQLRLGGQPLEPHGLVSLATFVESVDAVCAAVRRGSGATPLLADIAEAAASFVAEAAATRRAIAPSCDVVDDASEALRKIRDSLRRQRARLRSTLEGITRGRDTAKYLQDHIVADRGGRYVLMVRAEHQGALPGIVHGSSASGASLYLEPLATVQTNNDIVALAEQEKDEVFRILLALTDAYRDRADDLDTTLHVAAALDMLQAKARLAGRMQGVAPTLAVDGRLELRGARHPLLEGGAGVVANDILIVPPASALVISGPNTGGKTVALKAAGLLALMAQAGLHIPVEPGSLLTPFRSIFADIGDDQSIAASLSTFSARIAHLVEMERALELPALVLLDEVGGGTDPIEGGALGTAVIDHFRTRGATVVATTHDDALKSYAATTDGIAAAAMGFVPETYAPTYRLVYGAPGRSLALEIAERLGMPASVISAARSRRSDRESQLAEHLARVDREIAVLEQERQGVKLERQALAENRRAILVRESHVTEREAVLRKRLDDRVNERLREARAEIDRVVAQVKTKAEALAHQAQARPMPGRLVVSTGDLGQLRAQGRSALDTIASPLDNPTAPELPTTLDRAPAVGDRVFVSAFAADGIVTSVSGKHAEVDLRGKRMKVVWRDLGNARVPAGGKKPQGGGVTTPAPSGLVSAERELMVIGKRVDQALDEAEKFLDGALLADSRRLRVVHGHGTGRLRVAMTKFFREHPLVASVSPAPDNEGGNGATIVELKD